LHKPVAIEYLLKFNTIKIQTNVNNSNVIGEIMMNNSINYGNFIALLIKNNEDEFFDIATTSDNYTPKGNKAHLDKKKEPEHITGVDRCFGE